jgi:hypothetical protein
MQHGWNFPATGTLAAIALALLLGCSQPPEAPKATASQTVLANADQDGSPRRLRLLTADQLRNTLSYIFGPDISLPKAFAPVARTDGLLAVGTSVAGLTAGQLEIYQKTAAQAANQVVNERNRHFLVPCVPKDEKAADDACARTFLSSVGRLLYRRPLEPQRLADSDLIRPPIPRVIRPPFRSLSGQRSDHYPATSFS